MITPLLSSYFVLFWPILLQYFPYSSFYVRQFGMHIASSSIWRQSGFWLSPSLENLSDLFIFPGKGAIYITHLVCGSIKIYIIFSQALTICLSLEKNKYISSVEVHSIVCCSATWDMLATSGGLDSGTGKIQCCLSSV